MADPRASSRRVYEILKLHTPVIVARYQRNSTRVEILNGWSTRAAYEKSWWFRVLLGDIEQDLATPADVETMRTISHRMIIIFWKIRRGIVLALRRIQSTINLPNDLFNFLANVTIKFPYRRSPEYFKKLSEELEFEKSLFSEKAD